MFSFHYAAHCGQPTVVVVELNHAVGDHIAVAIQLSEDLHALFSAEIKVKGDADIHQKQKNNGCRSHKSVHHHAFSGYRHMVSV